MTKARDKIESIANDRISPYRGSYIPDKSEISITGSRYDVKYLLLFFYFVVALFIILGSTR